MLEQHLRPADSFLTVRCTTKREHHALHNRAFVLIYGNVVSCHKLDIPFVEIMNTLIVSNVMDMSTFCFEISLLSSQEFFSLSRGGVSSRIRHFSIMSIGTLNLRGYILLHLFAHHIMFDFKFGQ